MTLKPKLDYKEYNDPIMASIYDSNNQHDPFEKKFYFDFANAINAKKIIDLGCGTGLLTIPLSELGYQVIGVEPAESMLDIAKQKPNSKTIKWLKGDALDLSEENADLVIMTAHVAQFLLEDEYFLCCLQSINKSLKKGGYLVFDSRNKLLSVDELGWPQKDTPKEKYDPINGKTLWWVEILVINNNRITYEIHTLIVETQNVLTSINELIFRSKEEITNFLLQSNFIVEKIYGNWDKQDLKKDSPEFIFVAKKLL
jgi:SAM-dependent methyltransferase